MISAAFRPFYRAIVLMKCKFRQFLQSVLASPAAAPSPGPGPNQLRSEARERLARVLTATLAVVRSYKYYQHIPADCSLEMETNLREV